MGALIWRKLFVKAIEPRKFPTLEPYSFTVELGSFPMKNFVTVVSNVRANLLLCCSAAVLLAACGGGTADIDNGQQTQTAALSYDSASRYPNIATTDDPTAATTIPSSTEAPSDAGPDGSTHLYVAPTGSDSNPGTQAAPFLTIARADSRASAGYTIHVAPGTYEVSAPKANSNGIKTTRNGTSSARIKFVSDVKGAAKIVMSGTGIAWRSKGSYVDIDGFDISGSGRIGILAEGEKVTITNNFIHDLTVSGGCNGGGGAGIDTWGPGGNAVIDSNVVRNIGYQWVAGGTCNTVQGIYVTNQNNRISNNIISGVASVGINNWHGATASTIVNNTIFHSKMGIVIGQGDGGATSVGTQNNYVANNIVYGNGYGITEMGKVGGNNRYVNNLVFNSGRSWRVKGDVSGTISADPLFVNYQANGSGDYRLQSTSWAIDKGTEVMPPTTDKGTEVMPPTTDIAGVARPRGAAIDIGAYEF